MSEAMLSWLRTQLDEDERVAKEVDPDDHLGSVDDSDDGLESRMWPDHNAVGITACRVLAEVESKRLILDSYVPPGADPHPGQPCTNSIESDPEGLAYDEYESCERHLRAAKRQLRSDHVLRLMTIPYRDCDGYDPAWEAAS